MIINKGSVLGVQEQIQGATFKLLDAEQISTPRRQVLSGGTKYAGTL